uniref:Uncharacterized protein n=1 Tax=Anguilla anguilla TaxID=7936 RepID=A0A0E9XV47_ANGAN
MTCGCVGPEDEIFFPFFGHHDPCSVCFDVALIFVIHPNLAEVPPF